jgi:glucose 1-dehydrogenase
MDLRLRERRVIITGGAGGIGTAIAEAFADEGARVAINYIGDPNSAEQLAARLTAKNTCALCIAADVSDAAEVAAMFAYLDDRWGGVDILVNNAGVDGVRAVGWEANPEDWKRVISVNLIGAFLCAREALRRMTSAKKGVIINTTSVHEVIAWAGYSAYTASKAALAMMSKTLAQEAAPFGVRVLSIAPGAIRTHINRSVWSDDASLADLLTKIPLGRVGTPADIANLVAVLASDVSSYVTATSVFIDGGMTDYPSFAHGG